ncbi:hypothetical protein IAT40_000283 [Kwoniella sp. CBS 6097]
MERDGNVCSWEGQNVRHNVRMLPLIKSEDLYLQTFFPTDMATAKDKWIDERACCLEFFENDAWMIEMENKGMIVKKRGEWCPTKKWTSSIHPHYAEISLRQRMSEGYYQDKYEILPHWSSWDDIPKRINNDLKKKYRKFQVEHPYYFLLRELWLRTQTPAKRTEALLRGQRPPVEAAHMEIESSRSVSPLLPFQRRKLSSDTPTFNSKRVKLGECSTGPSMVKTDIHKISSRLGRRVTEPIVISDDDDEKENDRAGHQPATRPRLVAPASGRTQATSSSIEQRAPKMSKRHPAGSVIKPEASPSGVSQVKLEVRDQQVGCERLTSTAAETKGQEKTNENKKKRTKEKSKDKIKIKVKIKKERVEDRSAGTQAIDELIEDVSVPTYSEESREWIGEGEYTKTGIGDEEEMLKKSDEEVVQQSERTSDKGGEEDSEGVDEQGSEQGSAVESNDASTQGTEEVTDEAREEGGPNEDWNDGRPILLAEALRTLKPAQLWEYFEGKEIPLDHFTYPSAEALRNDSGLHDWIQTSKREV